MLNGNLNSMNQRLFFHQNINNFLGLNEFTNEESAKRILRREYRKLYQPLILDHRFEFRINSYDNIGIYATEVKNNLMQIFHSSAWQIVV
jgi:hypothetical protein